MKDVLKNIRKNCFTCKHLETDWDDKEYGNSQWLVCAKGEYGHHEERNEKMYDAHGKETTYLRKYKSCHEFPERVSFNDAWIDIKELFVGVSS